MSITKPRIWLRLYGSRCKQQAGKLALALALLLIVSGPMQAFAQARSTPSAPTQGPLSVVLSQVKVIKDPEGRERYAPVETVVPGDVIEYRATYRNSSATPMSGVEATLPVPKGTNYLPKSASAQGFTAEAATPDGRFAPEPLMRKVTGPDGKLRDETVPYSEYRTLRWMLGRIAGKGEVTVKARVQVERYESPARIGLNSPQSDSAARGKSAALANR
ncbi:DUF11 domain-containing protein [Montanilutibacter psychrotolerans]|uniref:DUF11 domain-containing protein n=1 Tax=Montanilutibacter psychrotolerans TaxID=1327343 RepID=A0A3M8T0N8_9GAMM|nr:DUF11 domain-containing protein [Lysobacter psychrotolerans]RNF85236.1 DUF11 domain-containing protein [Lysobacter psychrotolerans]